MEYPMKNVLPMLRSSILVNDLIRLLSTLLSTTETVESRKQILEDEFDIPMTKQIDEEVLDMCNLGMAVQLRGEERGIAKGMEIGRVEGAIKMLIDLFKKGILTLAQAAEEANMSPEEFQNRAAQQQ